MAGPNAKTEYQRTVDEAVDWFAEHGFTSAEKLAYWEDRIRRAAEAAFGPSRTAEEMLRELLAKTYEKMVSSGKLTQFHPGVARWTLEKVRPELRAELDRRIMASANLIRIKRKQRIEETLARFSGWASSQPAGGSAEPEKRETKESIKKPLASLPYENRRVLIDQGQKLTAALSDVVAKGGGAIAGVWFSHYRQAGYNFREDHRERDGHVYLIPGNWALEAGLIKVGEAGRTDQITQPAEEVFCFPGDSKVPFAGLVEKAFRRSYSGDLTELVTSSGKTLRATPNHPILTPRGWLPAGMLNEGDDVIEVADHLLEPLEEYENERVPILSEIFGALSESGFVSSADDRAANFHGDGSDGQVDIVHAAGGLLVDHVTTRTKRSGKVVLAVAFVASAFLGAPDFSYALLLRAANSIVRGFRQFLPTPWPFPRHAYDVSFRSGSDWNSRLYEALKKYRPGKFKSARQGEHTFSSNIRLASGGDVKKHAAAWRELFADIEAFVMKALEKTRDFPSDDLRDLPNSFPFVTQTAHVVKIKRSSFTGHVYNLQTENGWYATNGIITHNCRCKYRYIYSLRELEKIAPDMLTAKGRASLEAARAKIKAMV